VLKVKCTTEYGDTKIDITVQDSRHNGLDCVGLVKTFLNEYNVLESLVLVLKQFLKISSYNDPYKGGLSSYGLILMTVSFLQHKISNHQSIEMEGVNLGKLLLEFLWYYGFWFDYAALGIYTYIPNEKPEKQPHFQLIHYMPEYMLTANISDPLNSFNNVGKSSFSISLIKTAFRDAYMACHLACTCNCHVNELLGLHKDENHKEDSMCQKLLPKILYSSQHQQQ